MTWASGFLSTPQVTQYGSLGATGLESSTLTSGSQMICRLGSPVGLLSWGLNARYSDLKDLGCGLNLWRFKSSQEALRGSEVENHHTPEVLTFA